MFTASIITISSSVVASAAVSNARWKPSYFDLLQLSINLDTTSFILLNMPACILFLTFSIVQPLIIDLTACVYFEKIDLNQELHLYINHRHHILQ